MIKASHRRPRPPSNGGSKYYKGGDESGGGDSQPHSIDAIVNKINPSLSTQFHKH